MVYPEGRSLQHPEQITSNAPRLHYSAAAAWLTKKPKCLQRLFD